MVKWVEIEYSIYDQDNRLLEKTNEPVIMPLGYNILNKEIEEKLANANHVLEYFINRVPGNKNSIKSVYIKLTMSDSIRIM